MSREYARRSGGGGGGNLPMIIAIVGVVIVIGVAGWFFFGRGDNTPVATETPILPSASVEISTPTPSPAITPSPSPTLAIALPTLDVSTPTPPAEITPTPTPAKTYLSATVWANALNVREGPGTEYTVISTVKYGQTFKVYDETSSWIKIQLSSGQYGWIWEAYTSRGNDPLPTAPAPDPAASYVESAVLSADGTQITITFKDKAYSSTAKSNSTIIPIDAFTAKEGTVDKLTGFATGGSCAGGTYVILQLAGTTLGAELTVTVDGDKVFDVTGSKTGDYTKTFNAGADVTAPTVSFSGGTTTTTITVTFNEEVYSAADGTGVLALGDFFLSGEYTAHLDNVAHTAGSKTATLTISFTGMVSGNTAICALTIYNNSAYDAAGNACVQTSYNFTYTKPA